MQQSGKVKPGRSSADQSEDVELTIDQQIDEGQRARVPSDNAAKASRDESEKLKENRKKLNVNEEHKTPAMEKGHRGSFP